MSLKKIIFTITLFHFYTAIHPIIIMIDPMGDAKYTGNEIEDTFERSLTLQWAQEFKATIESRFSNIQVIVTRNAGETLQPLQNVSYANRMNVDLYICISFYKQETIPAHMSIFYYLENTIDIQHKYNPLHFYHISQAYLKNVKNSENIAKKVATVLKQKNINPYFVCLGAFGIPCTPLLGIQSPAFYIEAGLKHKNDWKHLIQPIIEAINLV